MHDALFQRNLDIALKLLEANPRCAHELNREMQSPFYIAVKEGLLYVVNKLLKQCPDTIEMVDLYGRNPFHIAIINNKFSVLELLLESELPEEILNKQDYDGNTPLHHAAMLHQSRSILWLLLNDPRINSYVINKEGKTAWDYQILLELMVQDLSNAIEKGDMLSLVNCLSNYPEMVYSVTPIKGNSVLHLAASKGDDWFVHHVLLFTNRNVGFIIYGNIDGDTPLHLAVRAGHLEVLHHLICYVAWAREIEPNLKLKVFIRPTCDPILISVVEIIVANIQPCT